MKKVFISYRHNSHQHIKNQLIDLNNSYKLFVDKSVNSDDISDLLPDETIRRKIRDEKLKDSTVTLFIHGKNTDKRKFIDWEIAASMINYTGSMVEQNSYQNAILIIDALNNYSLSSCDTEPKDVAIDYHGFEILSLEDKHNIECWKQKLPFVPKRILHNLIKDNVFINVIKWNDIIKKPLLLKNLIEKVAANRMKNNYDTSLKLMRRNL